MGSLPVTGNTALSGDLYTALTFQIILLLAITALAIGIRLPRTLFKRSLEPQTVEPTGRRILRIALGVLWIWSCSSSKEGLPRTAHP